MTKGKGKKEPEKFTKSKILSRISKKAEVPQNKLDIVFKELQEIVKESLAQGEGSEITIPGVVKLKIHVKPPTKEREGMNPRTKEKIKIPAKPARKVVKAIPLKPIREVVEK